MIKNGFKIFIFIVWGLVAGKVGAIVELPQEKPMVVVIASYNNSQWYDKNLSSVFEQKYDNYRVIYIDDCSTDNTYDLVAQKIKDAGQEHRVQIIHNEENRGALANIYHAVHSCANNEIIVILDGDDWFAHDMVLERVNRAYQNPNVWMTYGQHRHYPSGRIGKCREIPAEVIKKNSYREYNCVCSHLRTYYAWLFKKIDEKDLLYGEVFFPAATDNAVSFPLLEMSAGRWEFIDEVLYEYNMATSLNLFKVRYGIQIKCDQFLRTMKRYEPLEVAIALQVGDAKCL